MQSYDVIIGVIAARLGNAPYAECESRFSVGSGTVTRIMNRYASLGIPLEALKNRPPGEVTELFYPSQDRRHKDIPLPDFESMYERLTRSGSRLPMTLLWEDYKRTEPEGYSYSQFAFHFKQYITEHHGEAQATMLLNRVPGERMYVDWAGDAPRLLANPEGGDLLKAHFFCSTLGVSSLGFTEAFINEKTPAFMQGVAHALTYYRGAPRFITPDNLKTAVTKHTQDKLILTRACRDLEDFYGIITLPPPSRKPRGKPTVENYVLYTETHIIETLKARVEESGPYATLALLNKDVRELFMRGNERVERGRKMSRMELFEKTDLPSLKPLPREEFTIWDYAFFEKVPTNYHLPYDRHRYSVPHQMIGKPAILKASLSEICIADEHNHRIASHVREYNPYPANITDPAHRPATHAFYAAVNANDGAYYRNWAANIGVATSELIERILSSVRFEEQMYESCMRIVEHAKEYPDEAVERAASWCLKHGLCLVTEFRKCITEQANIISVADEDFASASSAHAGIRGKESFR